MSNWQKVLVDRFVLFNMFKLTLHDTMTITGMTKVDGRASETFTYPSSL